MDFLLRFGRRVALLVDQVTLYRVKWLLGLGLLVCVNVIETTLLVDLRLLWTHLLCMLIICNMNELAAPEYELVYNLLIFYYYKFMFRYLTDWLIFKCIYIWILFYYAAEFPWDVLFFSILYYHLGSILRISYIIEIFTFDSP